MIRSKKLISVLAVAIVAVSGCGSKSTSTNAAGASKSTVRLMVVGLLSPAAAFGGLSFPFGATGVQAAAAALNAAGGIDGHQLQIDVCDSKGNPNGSAQCGRTAVSNNDMAVVGTFDPIGAPQLLAVLEAAKIPYIGGLPASNAELSSSVSFQFDPGPNLSATALTKLWVDSGCKKVSVVLPANPGNDQLASQQKRLAAGLGVDVSSQLVTPGVADITPSLSTALSSHPDCFTYAGDGQTNVKFILGARKLGFTGQFLSSAGSLVPQFLGPLGAAGDGIKVINATLPPTSPDPMVAQYYKELGTYLKGDAGATAMNANEFSQDGWSSVQLVKQALTGSSDYSSKFLLSKIPTMCDVNVGNVYPHINFCKPVATNKTLTRVFNDHWQYFLAKGGHYTESDSTWHDLVSTFPTD